MQTLIACVPSGIVISNCLSGAIMCGHEVAGIGNCQIFRFENSPDFLLI
jgi:hypothetical protein